MTRYRAPQQLVDHIATNLKRAGTAEIFHD